MLTLNLVIVLAIVGFLIGLSKTAFGGLGLVSAAILANFIPARESTGVLLILLITGDLFAIKLYFKHVEWKLIRSISGPVVVGILGGVLFLAFTGDAELRKTIGAIIVTLVLLFPVAQRLQSGDHAPLLRFPNAIKNSLGTIAGFMSMVANSGGAPMSIYLLLNKNSKMTFLGNSAWIFFLINLFKVPFILALGILSLNSLDYLLPSMPAVVLGTLVGKKLISRVNMVWLQRVTLLGALLAGLRLLLS
jgi:uncharacterized membrane protein YfcA